MNEKPILCTGQEVRGILDGRQTQIRRVIKFKKPPIDNDLRLGHWKLPGCYDDYGLLYPTMQQKGHKFFEFTKSPYGRPGDRLWVREMWQAQNQNGQWWHEMKRQERPLHNWAWTNPIEPAFETQPPRWLPSIHMPKAASRIRLEVTAVRVERLQDISEDDAMAEGVDSIGMVVPLGDGLTANFDSYRANFKKLWNTINTKRGYPWDGNWWVWVVEFKPV